ncbi:protein-L-isoaspartate O-methyltransferase [Pseudonocardia sp. RS11V-5]|uniref:protein-L-isoaspartate O-methyltransferase family protein n=1 Tax=Pseudonocardia terrae TaxID=2905831 RepID=UPI001E3A9E5E|nr:protein-L-isoaspartate O-methyltransferase [Pseudonocardia terrae]MCE3554110.1 protein-L-isoaspartate O-methyltransferase [Pseudonocardia terrae]
MAPVREDRTAAGHDAAKAREAMVARLRAGGITDRRVLAAMGEVPRERFLRPDLAGEAYGDHPLDIGRGQTISSPWIVAFSVASLQQPPSAQVLEIGTGSGYAAAVLARCVGQVVTVERDPVLAERARALLAELAPGVEVRTGDGTRGAPDRAPFDGVVVTALASGTIPPDLVDQLAPGGTIVCPVGDHRVGTLVRYRDGRTEHLADVSFVPLVPDSPDR